MTDWHTRTGPSSYKRTIMSVSYHMKLFNKFITTIRLLLFSNKKANLQDSSRRFELVSHSFPKSIKPRFYHSSAIHFSSWVLRKIFRQTLQYPVASNILSFFSLSYCQHHRIVLIMSNQFYPISFRGESLCPTAFHLVGKHSYYKIRLVTDSVCDREISRFNS